MPVDDARDSVDESQLRTRVARVLETGFRVAVAIMALGLLLSAIAREPLPDTLGQPRELVIGLTRVDPHSVIGLGIMAIVLTPIASTIVIAWTFHEQGNRRYAAISGVVLLILLISIGLSLL